MLKIGDKVRIIRLELIDKESTNLQIGAIGTVEHIYGREDEFCNIAFSDVLEVTDDTNLNPDGTYVMYTNQLKVIEE